MDGWMDAGGVKTDEEIKRSMQRLDVGAGVGTPMGEKEIEQRLVDKLSLHLSQ